MIRSDASVSFIVPTIGRSSLEATLASIQTTDPHDEILVIGDAGETARDPRARYLACPRGHDWGATERNHGIAAARGAYLAFIDDDDVYAPGARERIAQAIDTTPGRPVLFRMRFPNGFLLWERMELRVANVGTPMIVMPNDLSKLGRWSRRRECDFDFLSTMQWTADDIVWRHEVIALLGHDDA